MTTVIYAFVEYSCVEKPTCQGHKSFYQIIMTYY